MYGFHYNYAKKATFIIIMPKKHEVKLLFTDTDNLAYEI